MKFARFLTAVPVPLPLIASLASLLTISSSQPVLNTAILVSMSMDKFAIFSALLVLTPNHRPILAQLASLHASHVQIPLHVSLASLGISLKEAAVCPYALVLISLPTVQVDTVNLAPTLA